MITYATSKDLYKIAKCHIAAFPKSVTSLLGIKVVSSMLEWYLSAPNKFLFYAEENGIIAGYCGGFVMDGSDAYGSGSGMTQFGFNQAAGAFASKPWLLLHPEVRKKYPFILTNVARKLGLKKDLPMHVSKPKPEDEPLTAGLVVIGVIPNLQQKGLGTLLQQEFERKAIEMGAQQLQLSVRINNTKAIKSYQRNGYVIEKEVAPSYVMIKKLK
jgi:ribosomal protein S18 acetylase RimI-like enzyme